MIAIILIEIVFINTDCSYGHENEEDKQFTGNDDIHFAVGGSFEVPFHFVIGSLGTAGDVIHFSIGNIPFFHIFIQILPKGFDIGFHLPGFLFSILVENLLIFLPFFVCVIVFDIRVTFVL